MQPYPHVYTVLATGEPAGSVSVTGTGLPTLATSPPREFDGPGDQWSPEGLLCAAVADCFLLTFRSIGRASKLEWLRLACRVEGTLERVQNVSKFTRFVTRATLEVSAGTDRERCKKLLEKAEAGCLIANSLLGTRALVTEIIERP